jgi:hypothetical protein
VDSKDLDVDLNSGRTGNDPSFPTFAGSLAAGWSTALDGAVYAEPLVVHGTVIVATENDSVYSLDPANGSVLWRQHLGTPVRLSTLPCGNIDPLGITGTPAFDPATGWWKSMVVPSSVGGKSLAKWSIARNPMSPSRWKRMPPAGRAWKRLGRRPASHASWGGFWKSA